MKVPFFWLVLALCAPPASAQSVRIYNQVEFAPTEFHRTVYKMMEACSGVEGDFEAIRWYVAKMILVGDPDAGVTWAGMWINGDGAHEPRIILDREDVYDGESVSHESLHDIYGGDVPMDIASRCVLRWYRLKAVLREEEAS